MKFDLDVLDRYLMARDQRKGRSLTEVTEKTEQVYFAIRDELAREFEKLERKP